MLYYIILCYITLYYVTLCYIMLYYVILCYVMLQGPEPARGGAAAGNVFVIELLLHIIIFLNIILYYTQLAARRNIIYQNI